MYIYNKTIKDKTINMGNIRGMGIFKHHPTIDNKLSNDIGISFGIIPEFQNSCSFSSAGRDLLTNSTSPVLWYIS
jgi:hypothetical protein